MEKNEIRIIYGSDPSAMVGKIAESANLKDLIGEKNKRIGLKPNLVVSQTADRGATTHPEIAEGLIKYLRKNGFTNISIMEGSWVGDNTDRAFKICSYEKIAKETGVKLINLEKDSTHSHNCAGMEIELCDSALNVDFMINVPVLKGHCQTLLTCALKNNKGVIPDREKRRFHSLGLHKPIAHLNVKAKNDFILVDSICGDLDFEEGGNPVSQGRIFAARDPVLCDSFSATLLGYTTEQIPYIKIAESLGIGSSDLSKAHITELKHNFHGSLFPKPKGKVRELATFIHEDQACSSCYANLIFALSRMTKEELSRFSKEKIFVGQGCKGKKGKFGIGACTSNFDHSLKGCPPSAHDCQQWISNLKFSP
jgi:uncharacterized protein (DUF362 family)